MTHSSDLEMVCGQCHARTAVTQTTMLAVVRGAGMLRREKEPDEAIVEELFGAALQQHPCPQCGAPGCTLEERDLGDDADWGLARKCVGCGKAILAERLEVIPDTTQCAACAANGPPAEALTEDDFCPRCGSRMVTRQSGGAGVTRYQFVCSTGCR